MRPDLTEEDFEQWRPLVFHVLKRFRWAYATPSDDEEGVLSIVRPADKDDLIQEGFLALLNAWKHWDETRGGEFSTYAYCSIWNAMLKAVRQHMALVKVGDWARVPKHGSEELQRTWNAALRCWLFSENRDHEEMKHLLEPQDIGPDPAMSLEERDLCEHCVRVVAERRGETAAKILEGLLAGRSVSAIARDLGYRREWTSIMATQVRREAARILIEEDLDGSVSETEARPTAGPRMLKAQKP